MNGLARRAVLVGAVLVALALPAVAPNPSAGAARGAAEHGHHALAVAGHWWAKSSLVRDRRPAARLAASLGAVLFLALVAFALVGPTEVRAVAAVGSRRTRSRAPPAS
jgi:hypothetical protein